MKRTLFLVCISLFAGLLVGITGPWSSRLALDMAYIEGKTEGINEGYAAGLEKGSQASLPSDTCIQCHRASPLLVDAGGEPDAAH